MNLLRRLRRPTPTKHLSFCQFFSTHDDFTSAAAAAQSDGAMAPAMATRKEIRAWCRHEYGTDWWEVAPLVKQERMLRAKKDLHRSQPQHTHLSSQRTILCTHTYYNIESPRTLLPSSLAITIHITSNQNCTIFVQSQRILR